jgi:hypothetical protein
MTRARDLSNDEANGGGATPPFVAGKNFVIGGGFDVWQRGTTFTPNGTYTADRWRMDTGGTLTVSQQTTGVPAGSRYCMRVAFGSTTYSDLSTSIETANVIPLQGKTITVQIKLRRNASLVGNLGFTLQKSASVDAAYGATWTTITTGTAANADLPTGTGVSDWYTLSYTATIPNDGTANSLRIIGGVLATQSSGAYWEIAQVQLEIGSIATPFARAGGSIGGELALCQRYYYRQTSVSAYGWMAYGGCQNTVNGQAGLVLPVQMRVVPTALEYANLRVTDSSYAGTLTSLALNTAESTPNVADIYVTASGITGGRPLYIGANNNSAAYIAVTAEL